MKMREWLWVDTSYLYALFVAADQNHVVARESFGRYAKETAVLHTSNMVVAELGNLLSQRFGHPIALSRTGAVLSSALITRHYANESVESAALGWWAKFIDQQFTLVDCISFEYMRRIGLKKVLTYDSDFTIAGYEVAGR